MKNRINHLFSFLFPLFLIPWMFSTACLAKESNIVAAVGGERHSVALMDDGSVWAWGANGSGQLGDGSLDDSSVPVQVVDPTDPSGYFSGVGAIAAGSSYWLNFGGHTLAVKEDGTVWAWGYGIYGQLGDGANVSRSAPVQVVDASDATGFLIDGTAVAAGDYHSLALKSDGTVWAWGQNTIGQLGDGTFVDRDTAVQVTGLSDVIRIAAGGSHGLALKSDGTVWAWGANPSGELGDGTWGYPASKPTPVQVVHPSDPSGYLTDVVAIAAGDYHSLALKRDGTLWSWGNNSYGQLGDGTFTNPITPVQVIDPTAPDGYLTDVTGMAGGDKYTIAYKTGGSVWTWGDNPWGQLGDDTTSLSATPQAVSGLSGIVGVDAGAGHSLAVDQNGVLWAWGANWSGQLGDGTTEQRTAPVKTVFADTIRTDLIRVIGHGMITPGEEATFAVDYENILDESLDDCVILVDLPGEFDYVSATFGGVYRQDRHQVYWNLVDVAAGGKGILTVTVAAQWGLAAHATTSLHAEIGARNIDTSFNLDDYLDHTANEVIAEKVYRAEEIEALLNENATLKRLYDLALTMDYRFDNQVREYTFSDGTSLLLMMMICPEPFGPIYITVSGESGYIQAVDETGMTLFNQNGGYSEDAEGNTTKVWGDWAVSHSPQKYKCIAVCIFNTVKDWATNFNDVYQGNKRLDCNLCRRAYKQGIWDSIYCGRCAAQYAKVHSKKKGGLQYGKSISDCIEDCEKDSNAWQCSAGATLMACNTIVNLKMSAVSFGKVNGGWSKHVCKNGKWKFESSEMCNFSKVCRQEGDKAKCVSKCRSATFSIQSDMGMSNLPLEKNPLEEPEICAINMSVHDIMFLQAHDPNAKSVNAPGDVLPGQTLTYTLEYENEGAGTAYGVYILDELDANLDTATLTVSDGGSYSEASRLLSWDIGELLPGEMGSVNFSIRVKDGLASGTEILNLAEVHFPSADEITPTNVVVNRVDAIVADPQNVATTADTPLAITLNGSDAGSAGVTYTVVEQPAYGSLSGMAPQLTYTPMAQFSGQDQFTFRVDNGQAHSQEATVRINVAPNPSDGTPPTVDETMPPAAATDVRVSTTAVSNDPAIYLPFISATFSEPMDPDTVTAQTFTIGGLSGTVAYDADARTAFFSPAAPLAYGTTYTARLDGAADLAGNPLAEDYTWQFTTQESVDLKMTLPDNASAIDFESVAVEETSQAAIVSLLNTGPTDLTVNAVAIVGSNAADFEITEDNCSGTAITESENEIVKIAFRPLSPGDKKAELSIQSNDPDTPDLRIPLSGKGITSGRGDSINGGYEAVSDLWIKATLQVVDFPVTLIWKEVGADITPSGDQVVSGYFYADPDDFAYGSVYNPELFVKIYIAANGWCNIAFNHVTVDTVTVASAHAYTGTAAQTGYASLSNRLLEHSYEGVAVDTAHRSGGEGAGSGGNGGYDLTASLWAKAILRPSTGAVNLIWKEVGTDTTPSGDTVVSGYFYASPEDFPYGSQYNPEVFVKVYIASNGWANMAFNHVTVDDVDISSAKEFSGSIDQFGTATLNDRLLEHQYDGVGLQ